MDRRTVVVIEDEPLVRVQAFDMFESAGLQVVGFDNGDLALDYLRENRDTVSAVFTDVKIHGDTDGLELAQLIAETRPPLRGRGDPRTGARATHDAAPARALPPEALAALRRAQRDHRRAAANVTAARTRVPAAPRGEAARLRTPGPSRQRRRGSLPSDVVDLRN